MPKINVLSEKQDRELVELLRDGSHEALGELYTRYKDLLISFCKKNMKNEADAEDIVQDIILQIWENRHLINPELSFSGYVQTITQNRVFYTFRQSDIHSRFVRNMLTNGDYSTNETEDSIINDDYTALLNEIIEQLPPMQQKVIRLSRIEGLSYKEIAELLNISAETVKKHAALALKKIKNQIAQHTDIHLQTIIALLMFFL